MTTGAAIRWTTTARTLAIPLAATLAILPAALAPTSVHGAPPPSTCLEADLGSRTPTEVLILASPHLETYQPWWLFDAISFRLFNEGSTCVGMDFEYDGEMGADTALDAELQEKYPFCRLSGPANVLLMPGLHSANISAKLMQKLGGGTVIGPILIGLSKPVQIVPIGSTVSDVVNLAAIAAHQAVDDREG